MKNNQILNNIQPATFSEIYDAARSYICDWQMPEFMDRQREITDKVNTMLTSVPFSTLNYILDGVDNILRISFSRIYDARLEKEIEIERTVKYAGVNPHIATQIELGAILVSSWGYDQTNVDFYCVVEMTKAMCKLLPLSSKLSDGTGNSMAGYSEAGKKIDFAGELLTKKFKDNRVRIESFASAHLWDGRKQYTSWYA